jgi:glycosyltransferase involved in cell wall biosynthesis
VRGEAKIRFSSEMNKRVWISWEKQRRSIELAHHFGCDLFIFEYAGTLRYPKSIWHTLLVLRREKPKLFFVQNPSMILATFACLYGKITSTFIIIDRHTTFLLTRKPRNTPQIFIFKLLHRLTLRFADLTIVTNDFLADIVRSFRGRPFVLPDKLPLLEVAEKTPLKGEKNILLISSFGADEPIEEVLAAMSLLQTGNVFLYISGNDNKLNKTIRDKAPHNVIFTGFLSDEKFVSLLFSVDIVIALTTSNYCMLCGCYEAVSACKPLITSKKKELQDYFVGAVFVDNIRDGICHGVRLVLSNIPQYRNQIVLLKKNLAISWAKQYFGIEEYLAQIVNRS